MIESIPLSKLCASPKNVRKVDPWGADKGLIAGISALGLLQNLVVQENDGMFEVVAGGLRYAALCYLRDSDETPHITKDYPVACLVAGNDTDIVELSLMENVQRKPMHPADEFMAYQAMIYAGKSVEVIATHFHKKKSEVKKLLKLASVAPKLIDLFRRDKFNLDCVMAFTVSDDQGRQIAAYDQHKNGYLHAARIRQFLTESSVTNTSAIARYVTVKAYKAAGGAVMSDLFNTTTYLSDAELLTELATKKLQAAAQPFEGAGWKWVEIEIDGPFYPHDYCRLNPEPVGVPKKLQASIAAAEAHCAEFEAMDWGAMDEPEVDAQSDLEQAAGKKLDDLQAKLEKYLKFSERQRALSGVVISFDNQAEQTVFEGLVKKADIKAARALELGKDDTVAGDAGSEQALVNNGESAALVADLKTYRAQIARAAIMTEPALAIDALYFSLCDQVMRDAARWERGCLVDVSVTVDQTPVAADDLQSTRAGEVITANHATLNTGWCILENGAERFAAFCALKPKEKQALVAYAVGLSLNTSIFDDRDGEGGVLVDVLSLDIADYWRPTDINYFKRITRDHLLKIGGELLGDEWVDQHSKAKKGELVACLHDVFNSDGVDQISPDQRAVINAWLPAPMTV